MRKILASVVLLVAIILGTWFAIERNTATSQNADVLHVAASYYPLYDFAKAVGGDKVTVINITPAGAEPHEYEPSPKILADMHKADVFIYNGEHLEPWTDSFVEEYAHTAVKASEGIELIPAADEDHAAAQVRDPHFWLDPVLAQRIIENIGNGFARADPTNKDYYAKNAAAYKAQLAQLDTDFRTGLGDCRLDTVISSHDAFTYLGKRYNLHIESIAGISPEEEPSAKKLAELSQLVRSAGIRYVFFERLVGPRLAATIAAETGAKTLVFDPIEGLTDADQKQGKQYIKVQHENLQNLRTALACR